MNNDKPYRYPGTRPFTENERDLFFGRDNDIALLQQQIRLEQFFVLYGISGQGKSSLLNAGVLPKLKESYNFFPLIVRFGLIEKSTTPTKQYLDIIKTFVSLVNPLLAKALPHVDEIWRHAEDEECFWFSCKSIQMQHPGKTILLVFDQFEELFMEKYNEADISRFAQLLTTLLFGHMPQTLQNLIFEKLAADENAFTPDELDLLLDKVNVHVVISIRSDKMMSLLNCLKPHIPHILQNIFELKPLTIRQVEDALIRSASVEGDFISPPFNFEDDAREKIIKYLSANKEKPIEAFQLQLICHYCENLIINSNNEKTIINVSDLGDLGDLSTIFNRHYESLISQIPEKWQHDVRLLVEEKLIVNNTRVPLPDIVIVSGHKVAEEILQNLVNSRLLRREPNSTGGFSFELSHDTLVEPILESAIRRWEKELNEKLEKEKADLEKQNKRQAELLELQTNLRIEADKAKELANKNFDLLKKFTEQVEDNLKSMQKASKKFFRLFFVTLVVSAIAILLAVYAFNQKDKAQAAEKVAIREKNISDSLLKIADSTNKLFIAEKVNNLFQKAKNLHSFDEDRLAVKYLEEAIALDSANFEVKSFLRKLKTEKK